MRYEKTCQKFKFTSITLFQGRTKERELRQQEKEKERKERESERKSEKRDRNVLKYFDIIF